MISSAFPLTHFRTITGENIPEDLFERILDFVVEKVPFDLADGKGGKKKRELDRCSRTCRYWAGRCQPRVFEVIRLRSQQDMDQFLSFIESPLSRISGYIKHLYLIPKMSDSRSWIHLVPLQLVPKLSLSPTINLHFWGDSEETHTKLSGPLCSVHYTLHSARPEFSSHISRLKLFQLQFRRFEDLAHLVGELRSLRTLKCSDVKWSIPVPENYVIPVCPPSLDSVQMCGCTDDSVGVLFLVGRRRRMLRNEAILPFRLDRNQQLLVTPLIYNLARAVGNHGILQYTIEKVDAVYHIGCKCRYSDLNFLFTPTNSLTSNMHLETIAINLTHSWRMKAAMKGDWKQASTLASRLSDLQKIVIGFDSWPEMLRFIIKVVNTQMKNLRDAGKLRYAIVLDEKTKRWMRASSGSDKLESTPFTQKQDLWRVYT